MLLRTILNGLYFSGAQFVSAPLFSGIGSILMLHRVRSQTEKEFSPNAHLTISPEFLDITILRLKQEGYRFVSMDQVAAILNHPEEMRAEGYFLAVTLDDGYRDNLENAVPIFQRHEVPFTIYTAPGLVKATHTLWWEDLEQIIGKNKRIVTRLQNRSVEFDTKTLEQKYDAFCTMLRCLTSDVSEDEQRDVINKLSKEYNHDAFAYTKSQLMNWQELKQLSNNPLCTIGAHTIGHFAVGRLSHERSHKEIHDSRELLAQKLGKPVRHFAYPYGYAEAAGPRDFQIAKEAGFQTAVTTRHGVIYSEHGQHKTALPRISLNGTYQSMRYVRTLLSGATTRISNRGGKLNIA